MMGNFRMSLFTLLLQLSLVMVVVQNMLTWPFKNIFFVPFYQATLIIECCIADRKSFSLITTVILSKGLFLQW